jgi:3-dehydroquinate synthase
MVDASRGGKTGVNVGNIKNQIGLFAHPIATFIDIEFLTTVPEEEWLNGYAEMLKHGLISNSENYDAVLEVISGRQNLSIEFLYENLKVKHNIVEEDPKEKGVRKLLNYGHTIGHALEGYFIESEFSHGWAIVCGMIMENYLSFKIGLLDKNSQDKIEKDLLTYYSLPDLTNVDLKAVIELMQHDKKNTQGKINCSLLKSVGNCTFDNYVTEEKILEVLMHYKNKQINPN